MSETVIGIIFSEDRASMLAVKRRDVPIWVLPGGGLDQNETPEAGVIRELKEETGLEVRVKRKVAELTPVNRLTNFVHLYECEAIGGKPEIGDETIDIGYYPVSQLPDPFFEIHTGWLQLAAENHPEMIRRPLSEVSWPALFRYFCRHPLRVVRCALSLMGLPINKSLSH